MFLSSVRTTCAWGAALILALIPLFVAMDYGGVLRWTHFASAIAILAAALLATTQWTDTQTSGVFLRRHVLVLPIFLWAGLAWFQSVALPPSMVETLSPASAEAYTSWIDPYLAQADRPSTFPISIAPQDTYHAFAMLLVLAGLVWASAEVFQTRGRIGWLLCAISLCGVATVLAGIWRIVSPGTFPMTGVFAQGLGFGPFVNRNNAALMLNFGFAASLGLLSWRLTALTGQEVDDPTFEFNDLFALVSDRDSAIGVLGAATCMAGLLICGSRGGLVALLVGALLAFGWVRQRRGFMSIPVLGFAALMAACLMIVPLNISFSSLKRFKLSPAIDSSTILQDGRVQHWRDGWEAALAHFPAGSGASTYAYAYLPFQQTSSHAWFHHGDNLWLEMLVEQGFTGVLLTIATIAMIILSLRQLSLSHDPIDQGLRTTGWFSLGAILVSQAFDFGFILPANLFLATMLFATIISRDAATRMVEDSEDAPRIVFKKRRHTAVAIAGAVLACTVIALALPTLKRDAEVDNAVRRAEVTLVSAKADPYALRQQAEELQRFVGTQTPPSILTMLAKTNYQQARLAETREANPESDEEILEVYKGTSVLQRRLRWRQSAGDLDVNQTSTFGATKKSTKYYQLALQNAAQSLLTLPLDGQARATHVYLDFVHQDPALTKTSLQHMAQFYRNNPALMMRIARFAADSNESELATTAWKSALLLEPVYTAKVIQLTNEREDIDFKDVLPDQPKNYRAAARYLIDQATPADDFLSQAYDSIACEESILMSERCDCEALAGDIAYTIGRTSEAFQRYRKAVALVPENANVRLKFIRRLREKGMIADARKEARWGRTITPSDDRFDRAIKEMAKWDLEDAARTNTP